MSSVQSGHGQREDGARMPHVQFVQALENGMSARLLPLLMETIQAEKDALGRRMRGEAPPADGPEDIANLNIIAGQITAYERRWRERFGRALRNWPDPPDQAAADAFGLVSDEELQAQLIGQPVTGALERRHADVLDTIDKRLWSLAAVMGGRVRPENPFSPRHVVDGFLQAFTAADCGQRLRGALLGHCERLAGERLAEAYAWCNRQLADAGFALASASDYATLAATTVSARSGPADVAKLQVWGPDNALAPTEASWRVAGSDDRPGHSGALRGVALRHAARVRRDGGAGRNGQARELRSGEFLAALSLLQGEATPLRNPTAGYGPAMREGLSRVAGSLGIDSNSTAPSPDQDDALDVVGGLFDHLATHYHLSDQARAGLTLLALPCLRLALAEPGLFDPPQSPALRVLSQLVELWDGNRKDSPAATALHELADAVAQQVAEEYHGDGLVFESALQRLETTLAPLRRRAAISERRAWQAIEGGERLEAARRAADRELQARLSDGPMLPAVAAFLQEQWRQSLAQAWLRSGPESERYAAALALGDAIVRLDADAAMAEGAPIAARLVALQPGLQECYLACGLDEQGAGSLLAGLVAEFANPDAPRALHEFIPLSQDGGDAAGAQSAAGGDGMEPGRTLVHMQDGAPLRPLRLAWRSPLSGTCLLVSPQGARELLLAPTELAAMLADGRLLPRPPEGPVEAALRQLETASERG